MIISKIALKSKKFTIIPKKDNRKKSKKKLCHQVSIHSLICYATLRIK